MKKIWVIGLIQLFLNTLNKKANIMIEYVITLIPAFFILIISVILIDLYLLVRKSLKLKIKYYSEKVNRTKPEVLNKLSTKND